MTPLAYALFLGCKIPASVPAYEKSTRAVLARLGVTLVDLEFGCCGYPARDFSRDAFAFAAARNLALAERAGLDLLTPCMCCFGTLRHAIRFLDEDRGLRSRVERGLASEGLRWSGRARVEHLLPVLASEVGLEAIAAEVRRSRVGQPNSGQPNSGRANAGERIAAHYGCHALRPGDVTHFDNPLAPTIFESLIRAAGAIPVDWPLRLDCCGDPLHEANTPVAERMTRAKIVDAVESGARAICTACPHCHARFESARDDASKLPIDTVLYTQLLGLAMGLPAAALGL